VVSGVETLNFLKKSLGVIIKRLEESGVVSLPSFADHSFVPELEVDDVGVSLSLPGMVFKVRNVGDAPVLVNLDRPVGEEYLRVWPGTYRVIPRISGTVYLKAPTGFKTKVELEVLRA
jgi:hypothetical protein